MSAEMVIGDPSGNHVTLRVAGPDSIDPNAEIEISVIPWLGRFPVWMCVEGLEQFAEEASELSRSLSGVAVYDNPDGYLELRLIGDGRGHIRVRGKARDRIVLDEDGQFEDFGLSFEFEIDQTYLRRIIDGALALIDVQLGR